MSSFSVRVIEDTVTPVLAKLPQKLMTEVAASIQGTGEKMKDYSYQICPKRTGYLASTIYFAQTSDVTWELGATADYSLFVEMGTWKMRAQPFIRPAFEQCLTDLNQAIIDGMMRAVTS